MYKNLSVLHPKKNSNKKNTSGIKAKYKNINVIIMVKKHVCLGRGICELL